MSMTKVIETARAELGYTETPVNRTKYWQDYDPSFQGQPWCVAFLWWVFNTAGERMAFFGGGKTASCSVLLRWYKEQGLTVPVEEVQVGDIVLLNFSGTNETQHCGLVTRTSKVSATGGVVQIATIEGNTTSSDGSQSNGGMVCEKMRYPSQIVAVCRPQYQPEPAVKDDVTGYFGEASVRKAIAKKVMTGYKDGTWRPNGNLTRGEFAVVMDRLGLLD